MTHIGIDGCPNGWVSVTMKSGRFTAVNIFQNIVAFCEHHQARKLILMDIPIDLVDRGTESLGYDSKGQGLAVSTNLNRF